MTSSLLKKVTLFFCVSILVSCGGGDGGGAPATTYSFAQLKNLTPGYTKTYSLTGSDSNGDINEATLTITIKAPDMINGKSVIPLESVIQVKNISSGGTGIGTATAYYSAGNVLELLERGGGVTCTPTSYNGLPDSATIGQSGTIGVIECTDGTRETGAWRLDASGSNAKLIETYSNKLFSGELNHSEDDGYIINANGDIAGLEIKYFEPPAYTLNLSGK